MEADHGSFVRGSTAAGGFFGAIYELPNDVVLGIEADFFVAGLNGSLQNQRFVAGVDINWLARIRARLGYPIDSFLLFVTASLTIGEVGASLDIPSVRMSWRERSVETGRSVAGGFEYAVSPNLPLRADAVCFDLGTPAPPVASRASSALASPS